MHVGFNSAPFIFDTVHIVFNNVYYNVYYNVLHLLYYNVTMCVTHVQTSPLPQIDANSRAIGGNRKSWDDPTEMKVW